MRIYISGISGTAMGPLALMAKDAGMDVCGSDLMENAVSKELKEREIAYKIGPQDGKYLQEQYDNGGVDWFVYTSALPKDHVELKLAKKLGIKVTKRDEFIAHLIDEMHLKMVAVAGTHGKTTTTAMIVWGCQKLNVPISFSVGSTLGFAPAGQYTPGSEYFVYEADEYDRNFLHFHPWLAVITTVTYDHPDIYPTEEDYKVAFAKFIGQSKSTIVGEKVDSRLTLAGEARRYDAMLAMRALQKMTNASSDELIEILNEFPGVGRRFERIADGVYTDYAHHPEEIEATLQVAQDEVVRTGLKGVVAVYEPHQNTRQHEVRSGYKDAFVGVAKLFWLPTYLTRENPDLDVISPSQFIDELSNAELAEVAEADDKLADKLKEYQKDGYLILLMTAGPADKWYRKIFN